MRSLVKAGGGSERNVTRHRVRSSSVERPHELQGRCDMSTILIIVLLILLLGGGGYYGHSRYGGSGLGGVLGLVLVVAVVVWLVGGLHMG
jgi:hypothetical protein